MVEIKSILNPVRILTIEEWMKVAEMQWRKTLNTVYPSERAIKLMSRFESLTKQALTREFVENNFKGVNVRFTFDDDRIKLHDSDGCYLRSFYTESTVIFFLHSMEEYNRFLTSEIQLEWTDNFLNELLK